jgi:hypothetical protein
VHRDAHVIFLPKVWAKYLHKCFGMILANARTMPTSVEVLQKVHAHLGKSFSSALAQFLHAKALVLGKSFSNDLA